MKNLGLTLVELLVIIGILTIIIGIFYPSFRFFQTKNDLENSAQEIINILRLAQNKTLASEDANKWGVYFDTNNNQYVLFRGENYINRDISFDEIYNLSNSVDVYEVNFSGNEDIVFKRITGEATHSGEIYLRLKKDYSKIRTIIVQSSGQITLIEETIPSDDNRIKDSRKVYFDYSRLISIPTEVLTLSFETGFTKDILISQNLKNGQFFWEGEIDVGGGIQRIKIHTYKLNNPDTQFCIHRDRRFNSRRLTVTLSGDSSGYLIEYSADGLTTNSNSIFVNDLEWQ